MLKYDYRLSASVQGPSIAASLLQRSEYLQIFFWWVLIAPLLCQRPWPTTRVGSTLTVFKTWLCHRWYCPSPRAFVQQIPRFEDGWHTGFSALSGDLLDLGGTLYAPWLRNLMWWDSAIQSSSQVTFLSITLSHTFQAPCCYIPFQLAGTLLFYCYSYHLLNSVHLTFGEIERIPTQLSHQHVLQQPCPCLLNSLLCLPLPGILLAWTGVGLFWITWVPGLHHFCGSWYLVFHLSGSEEYLKLLMCLCSAVLFRAIWQPSYPWGSCWFSSPRTPQGLD